MLPRQPGASGTPGQQTRRSISRGQRRADRQTTKPKAKREPTGTHVACWATQRSHLELSKLHTHETAGSPSFLRPLARTQRIHCWRKATVRAPGGGGTGIFKLEICDFPSAQPKLSPPRQRGSVTYQIVGCVFVSKNNLLASSCTIGRATYQSREGGSASLL